MSAQIVGWLKTGILSHRKCCCVAGWRRWRRQPPRCPVIHVREQSLSLTDPEAIDLLCALWVDTRDPRLAQAISQAGYVARQPPVVRWLSALQADCPDVITENGSDIIMLMLHICEDTDPTLAERARHVLLRILDQPDAQELVCRYYLEYNNRIARDIALARSCAPRDPHRRALFYFLTGQWEQYEHFDFDHRLLKAVYEQAGEGMRRQIMTQARQAGQAEVWSVLVGKRRRRTKSLTDDEWTTTLSLLGKQRNWAAMWRLVSTSPPIWSIRLLMRLARTKWAPENSAEKAAFSELISLARACNQKSKKPLRPVHNTLAFHPTKKA